MTVSSHKVHGPKGCGGLLISKEVLKRKALLPLICGGGQEDGLRSGTENTLGIAGFAGAVAEKAAALKENAEKMKDSASLSSFPPARRDSSQPSGIPGSSHSEPYPAEHQKSDGPEFSFLQGYLRLLRFCLRQQRRTPELCADRLRLNRKGGRQYPAHQPFGRQHRGRTAGASQRS